MTTINPCPFCGNEDIEIDEVRIGEYAVDCPECECIGPIKPEIMSAITAWNGAPQSIVNRDLLAFAKQAADVLEYYNENRGVTRDNALCTLFAHANAAIAEAEAA